MKRSRRGDDREVKTAKILKADGWLVGSLRHIEGPGDLLAHKAGERARLIEVKSTRTPYAHFGRDDRAAMFNASVEYGVSVELAWWAPRSQAPRFIRSSDWPTQMRQAA